MQSKTYIQTFYKIDVSEIKRRPFKLYKHFGSLEEHINSNITFKDNLSEDESLELVTGEIMGRLFSRFPPEHAVWGNTRIREGIIYFPKKNPMLVRNSSAYSVEASLAHERNEEFFIEPDELTDSLLSDSLTLPRVRCIELRHEEMKNPESLTFKIYTFIYGKNSLNVAKKQFKIFSIMRFFTDSPEYVDSQSKPYVHLISIKNKMNNFNISASGRDLDDPNYGFVYSKL